MDDTEIIEKFFKKRKQRIKAFKTKSCRIYVEKNYITKKINLIFY